MANPMMQMLSGSRNNPLAILDEFRKFAAGMTPQKAQQEVERLLQSGQMSQAQFQELRQQAEAFARFLK